MLAPSDVWLVEFLAHSQWFMEDPMIEALRDFPDNIVAFTCKGNVTRLDYETVLVPTVEKALNQHKKIRLYYQIGPEFAGIDPGAMWQDFKVGVEHLLRWERIAIVTDVDWIKHTIRVFSFLIPGEVKLFPISETANAREWIVAA